MDDRTGASILVAGTGPAGLVAALALADAGFAITLLGPEPNGSDKRTTALMNPALNVLGKLGLLDALASETAPIKAMRIVDGSKRLIRSPTVTFRAAEIDEDRFGLNMPNSVLIRVLAQAVAKHPVIEWRKSLVAHWELMEDRAIAHLDGGNSIEAPLAVAADGRGSPAREAAGIRTFTRAYPQAALVLNFDHRIDHAFTSTEFHTETGPCTQVPLPGGKRSSLVWVVHPETAAELAALDSEALSRRIEARMQSMLGRVAVEAGRQVYPLSAVTPWRFANRRVALVGEAAHVFPPIGAQGLNLGIRDVSDLVEITALNHSDPGSSKALNAYEMKRRPDILARSSAVNLLNMALLSNLLPAQLARSTGLSMLRHFAPLRGFFMREGLRPGSGFTAITGHLRK